VRSLLAAEITMPEAKFFIAIALTSAAISDACAIFKHGRITFDVDGLSEKCCGTVAPLLDDLLKKEIGTMETGIGPGPGEKEAFQQETMMTFMSGCCSDSDLKVFDTLMPEEPPESVGQMQQMCAMMQPPSAAASANILELIGVGPTLRLGGLSGASKPSATLPTVISGWAAGAVGLASGVMVTFVMMSKFGEKRVLSSPLLA